MDIQIFHLEYWY